METTLYISSVLYERIRRRAIMWHTWQFPAEDLLQEGLIEALIAPQTFKPERGYPLEVWAYFRAYSRMRHCLRDHYRSRKRLLYYDGFTHYGEEDSDWVGKRLVDYGMLGRDFVPMLIDAICPEVPEVPEKALREGLTGQEYRVLVELTLGKNAPQVAAELFLSTRTVQFHINNVYKKWKVNCIVSAYREAIARGVLDAPQRRIP